MYQNKSLKQYLDDLAAKLPAPGGGSAAAATAAMGVALISMVINFTLGKPKYAKYQQELDKILIDSENIRKRLMELVDLDVQAFKSKDIEKSLNVPLEVSNLCVDAIGFCPGLVGKGNVNLISDVAVAAILIEAGFSSALLNVNINLKFLKDKERINKISQELNKNKEYLINIRQDVEEKVDAIIRG